MLAQNGIGGTDEIQHAAEESHGLGLFVRSLVGFDREAANVVYPCLSDHLGH